MNDDQEREGEHSHVGHEDEPRLVDGSTLLLAPIKTAVQRNRQQFNEIEHQKNKEKDADIGDKRQLWHGFGNIGGTKHHQSRGDGQQVEQKHQQWDTVFQHFALTLNQRKMTLEEKGTEHQEKLTPKRDNHHCKQKQQQTENQRNPIIRLQHWLQLELCGNETMQCGHGTSRNSEVKLFD